MSKFLPAGWDENRVITGLHNAMTFGQPTDVDDQATFVFVDVVTAVGPADEEGVPFSSTVARTSTLRKVLVPCAVSFSDQSDAVETFGTIQPSRIVITLLDVDYQQIVGFDYVIAGGDKYYHRLTEPPVALGSFNVWSVHATAQDER